VEVLEDEYVKFIESEFQHAYPVEATAPKTPTGMEGTSPPPSTSGQRPSPPSVGVGPRRCAPARPRRPGRSGRLFIVEGGERAAKEKGLHVYFTLK
jgi:hypothetical protein